MEDKKYCKDHHLTDMGSALRWARNWVKGDHERADEWFADFLTETAERDRLAAIDDPRDQLIEEMKEKATGELKRWLLECDIPRDVLLLVAEVFDNGRAANFAESLLLQWLNEREAIAKQQPQQPANSAQDAPQDDDRDQLLPEILEKQPATTTEKEAQRLYQQYQFQQKPAIVDPSALTWKCPDESLASEFIAYKADRLPAAEQGNVEAAITRLNSDPAKTANEWKMFIKCRESQAALAQMSYEDIFKQLLEPKLNRRLRQIVQERNFNFDQLRIIDQTFETAKDATEPNSFCMEHIPFLKEIVTQPR